MKTLPPPKLPETPTEIWDTPCVHCPSTRPPDPEALDMEGFYRRGEIAFEEASFPCAWRPEKLCKGICDILKAIDEEVL